MSKGLLGALYALLGFGWRPDYFASVPKGVFFEGPFRVPVSNEPVEGWNFRGPCRIANLGWLSRNMSFYGAAWETGNLVPPSSKLPWRGVRSFLVDT